MPLALAMCVHEALAAAAADPPARGWPAWLYELVGRSDHAALADDAEAVPLDWHHVPLDVDLSHATTTLAALHASGPRPSATHHTDTLAAAALGDLAAHGSVPAVPDTQRAATAAPTDGTSLEGFRAPVLLFPKDRRIVEVARLLSSSKLVVLHPLRDAQLKCVLGRLSWWPSVLWTALLTTGRASGGGAGR